MDPYSDAGQRGTASESLIGSLLNEICQEEPEWLLGWRYATQEEDAQGADLFAMTKRGDVPIQVKTNGHKFKEFNKKRPDWKGIKISMTPRLNSNQKRNMREKGVRGRVGFKSDAMLKQQLREKLEVYYTAMSNT